MSESDLERPGLSPEWPAFRGRPTPPECKYDPRMPPPFCDPVESISITTLIVCTANPRLLRDFQIPAKNMLTSETGTEEDAASVCHGSPATSKAKPHSPGHKREMRIPRHGRISRNFYSFIYLFAAAVVVVFKGPDSQL